MDYNHRSSDEKIKKNIASYNSNSKIIKTHVVAKNESEMLDILSFDFLKFPKEFKLHRKTLKDFLYYYRDSKRSIILEMVHNAHIITRDKHHE